MENRKIFIQIASYRDSQLLPTLEHCISRAKYPENLVFCIAWQHLGGHIWRYILEPVDGGTKVTEQFDYNGSKSVLALKLRGSMASNEKFMVKTLENIEKHFTA